MSDQTPQVQETVILPLSVADTQQLPLITDTQYLEIASSTSINRKFFGVARAGIYRGFACLPDQGLNVKIKNTQSQNGKAVDFGVALIEREDFLLTVRQQHDIVLPVPAGATSYVVLEAFYKHGVKTKQVSKDATVDAANVKVLPKDDVKPHHLILAKVVVPDGATSLQASNFHYEDRKAGGYDLDAHKDELDPHEQYEREDNAANNAEIDGKSTAVKHVKLSQLWRAINNLKAEHNPFPKYWHNDETATQADAEAGSTNNKIMTALRTQQWWEKAKTKAQTVTAAWTFTGAFKVKSADEANSNVDIEGHRPDNTGIIGALRFLNRSDGKSFSLTSDGNGLLKWANHKVFHEGNRNITSAINNPSEIIYASAKGVKTAFDKGVEAINLANTKVAKTSISDAINSASQTTVGSSKAVKIAFDKAVEAINLANTKVAKTSISDSVTSASKTTVGSSKAIKTAFDKAVDAINLANTKVAKTQVSDSVTSDSQTNVASSKAAKIAHNKGVEALNKANTMIPKAVISDSVTSDSQTNVGSSKAVKTANDRANQAYNLASTKVAKADISDSVTSDSSEDIASSKAAKIAHDKGVEALNKANTMIPKAVISESVTSSSNTTVASSKAVKTAHDKGIAAINTANTKVAKSSISDSVTSSSSSTVGSSKAVKAAHDKGVEALNKANSKWTYVVASKAAYGATKLLTAVNSTSETLAATPKAVKVAYDKAVSAYNLAASKITKAQGDSYYLAKNAKADNASKLDGLSASQLIRSDADDVVTGNTQWASGHAPYLKDNSNGGRIPAPAGGFLYNGASSATGAIKIKLPTITKGQSDMLSFEVSIFDYAHNESVKLLIAGYQYGTKDWTNQTVITLTNSAGKDYRVRFGNDGTSHCLWIGETNSTWNHLQIGVFNVLVGYSADATKYAAGWTVSITSQFDTVQDTVSASLPAAQTATKLQSARTIALAGDATGSTTFDGSGNKTITVTVKDDSHNHVIGNIDGLSTELNNIKKAIDTKLGKTSTAVKAHDAHRLEAVDDRDVQPKTSGISARKAVKPFFVSSPTVGAGSGYSDLLLLDTYSDATGGKPNALAFSKTAKKIFHLQPDYDSTSWGVASAIYTEANKPNKNDVGLNHVVNAPQTSAINDSSTTKYATAKGVKTAYDRGTEALNAANTKVAKSSISNSVSSTSTTTVASSKAVRDTYNRAVAAENNAKNHTNTEISKLLGGAAQQDLDTIRELGEALKDNDSDIGAINTELGKKANKTTKVSVSGPLTGGGDLSANRVIGIKDATTGQKGAVQLTDSVGSTSQVLAATARAVKTAHDKGVEALNKANSKWTYVVASKTTYGATKLLTAINSTSETLAATPKAVKMAYDLAASKLSKSQGDSYYLGKTDRAADTSKISGHTLSRIVPFNSQSDFTHGTLIKTDLTSSEKNGPSFVMEITGKSYSGAPPFSVTAQGYLYNNGFMNVSALALSGEFTDKITMMNGSDGKLWFWFPRMGYWQSFSVMVWDANGKGQRINRVVDIVDSTKPTSSKKVDVSVAKAYSTHHKPTAAEVGAQPKHVKLDNFVKSFWDTNGNQDLLCRGKRALVGHSTLGLEINYGNDFGKITINGQTTFRNPVLNQSYIGRTAHAAGYMVGSYNNVGENSRKTNPIYTIGSSYQPSDNALNDMYGIGYSHTNAGFLKAARDAGCSGWGAYFASDGDARAHISAQQGRMWVSDCFIEGSQKLSVKYLGINDDAKQSKQLAVNSESVKTLQLTANAWKGLLNNSDFKGGSGVYQILIQYSSAGKGGNAYTQSYTGQFYWFAGGTNQVDLSEIPLHNMGHADNSEYIFLRTRTELGNKIDQKVEIMCNKSLSKAVPFTVKLAKIMG